MYSARVRVGRSNRWCGVPSVLCSYRIESRYCGRKFDFISDLGQRAWHNSRLDFYHYGILIAR